MRVQPFPNLRVVVLMLTLAASTADLTHADSRFPFPIPGDDASPSFTNLAALSPRPAGAEGFVRIRDGHFQTDSGRIRFWGVNTTFDANFPGKDDAEKVAAHLAKLGINAVRIHHHDGSPAPRGIWGPVTDGQRRFSPEQVDRLDYYLAQLHRRGIYANLNLHVSRSLNEAEGYSREGLPRKTRYDKYLLYFEPRVQAQLKEFCRNYLLHENPYRGLRRVDDPAIAMIEITNENSFSRTGPELAAELPEPFRGEFKRQWNEWLARTYRTTAALRQAWIAGNQTPGSNWVVPPREQSIEDRSIEIPTDGWSGRARDDAKRFMIDREEAFFRDMVDFLKKELGVRVPITGSQITYLSPKVVADTCDYADVHAYWQHPRFPNQPWDPADWVIRNVAMETNPAAASILERAPWRLLDRPFTISEWNIPEPNDHAAGAVPFAALVASLQDWDGVFFFQYVNDGKRWYGDTISGYFSFNGQPAKLALLTACAQLFRRGDLAPLSEVAAGTFDRRVPSTLGLSRRVGIDPRAAQASRFTEPSDKRLASPDGRVVWDATIPKRAHVTVNTPATRAAWGLVGNQRFHLGGVEIAVGAAERNYAVVVLTAMDDKPLETTAHALLTAVGSAANRGMQWNEARTSVGRNWGTGPAEVNGIPMEITLPRSGARVFALDGRGQRTSEVSSSDNGKAARFKLGPAQQTLWYEIVWQTAGERVGP
ncbi:MAG: hypothetical protein KBA71_11490 [Opitutaceae bacterium]|nr:hypothetical protein [Opitutaceae bacterium]